MKLWPVVHPQVRFPLLSENAEFTIVFEPENLGMAFAVPPVVVTVVCPSAKTAPRMDTAAIANALLRLLMAHTPALVFK